MKIEPILDRKSMWIYPWYISDITATADIKEIAGLNVEKVFVTIKDDLCTLHYDTESVEKIGTYLLEKILRDERFFKTVLENVFLYADELLAFCQGQTEKDLGKLAYKELVHIYEEYTAKLRKLRTWGWVPVFMDGLSEPFFSNYLLGKLRVFLDKQGLTDKTSEYYSVLSSSDKESEVQKEEIARLEILEGLNEEARNILKSGEISLLKERRRDLYERFRNHLREFGALTYAYTGPAMTLEYLLGAVKEDLEADPSRKKKEIEKHFQTIQKTKEKIIREIGLPEDLQYAFQVSAKLMYIKDWRKGSYQKSYLLMDQVLTEIAHRLGMALKEVKFMTLEEVKETIAETKREYYKTIVPRRLEYCCSVVENGVAKIYEGEACDVLKKELVHEKESPQGEVTELKGMIAYKGKVRGAVKIVLTVEDISKVKKGGILVSSATNPDLISAMKKAAAFVTDSGGIISHAAIVSREMKKPCVVGTKIATKVLKDGDMVEVDADNGIVRRI